ncbi:hypothetical protein J3R30DRAFT_3403170 [Lentinula aciculospora]|uniref:Uncharacterized protein n=1 Tax=Lentinula aciculospora TaxID=153920 RepID=A0A9W9AFG4_9AGAR|nr:hypothetical protein J3R30DRAFT_3403170 [Lentinula aciculospora]
MVDYAGTGVNGKPGESGFPHMRIKRYAHYEHVHRHFHANFQTIELVGYRLRAGTRVPCFGLRGLRIDSNQEAPGTTPFQRFSSRQPLRKVFAAKGRTRKKEYLTRALPQQASVSLFEFESVPAGVNPTAVIGTEWAQPIGTASDGSRTTFVVEDVVATSIPVSSGATELTAVTITGIETIVVSASGWAQSNFPTTTAAGSTQLGGGLDCHFTASSSGECVEEEVLDDGTTSTRTLTGDVITQLLPISTGTLPSGIGASTSGSQRSTVTSVSATSSGVRSTITALSTSSSSSSAAATSTSASSNASPSLHRGYSAVMVSAIVSGMLGASVLFL